MVEEVTAFADGKGTLHKTKLAALEADAIEVLSKMGVFNHASAQAVVKECVAIHRVLDPLVEEARRIVAEQPQPGDA